METDEAYLRGRMGAGDVAALTEAPAIVEGFPEGVDSWGHSWIGRAVESVPRPVVDWMLARGVVLAKRLGEVDPDRAARTNCDDYATPEEEARHLGHGAAADFLRDWQHPLAKKWRKTDG